MTPEARQVWAGLEFRTPAMLRLIEPLTAEQMFWRPGTDRNSISWQLWHIAEVEDNWVRDKVLGLPRRYPFGRSVRDAAPTDAEYPSKEQLLEYFHQVRALSRERLERGSSQDFERRVTDEHFGELSVRDVWAGVVTSFAWHAGQVALTVGLMRPQ